MDGEDRSSEKSKSGNKRSKNSFNSIQLFNFWKILLSKIFESFANQKSFFALCYSLKIKMFPVILRLLKLGFL